MAGQLCPGAYEERGTTLSLVSRRRTTVGAQCPDLLVFAPRARRWRAPCYCVRVADFRVIADVSTSLQTLLNDALLPLGVAARLHDLGTPVPTNPPIVTIFLYEVSEDAASRNRPGIRRVTGPNAIQIERAPMALLLKYLITPWSGDAATDHRILGRSMQVLYDNAVMAD